MEEEGGRGILSQGIYPHTNRDTHTHGSIIHSSWSSFTKERSDIPL